MSSNFLAALPQLWAIRPEALTAFVEELRLQPAEARNREGRPAAAGKPYSMDGPVAVIPVEGVLTKRGLSFWGYQLAPGMRDVAAALRSACADRGVKAILLDVDSPGGTVDGIEELAEVVAEAGSAKPLYAFADGLMASAAYWLSCNAREIAAPATAEVGSIGVVMMHREYSKALEGAGITCNIIAAGHYKAAGNMVEPLSEEMRAYLQSGIDDTYELFLQAVERGRNVSREKALAMADGKMFTGTEALKTGLVDRVCSREAFITHIKEGLDMTLAELREQHPEAVAALRAELEQNTPRKPQVPPTGGPAHRELERMLSLPRASWVNRARKRSAIWPPAASGPNRPRPCRRSRRWSARKPKGHAGQARRAALRPRQRQPPLWPGWNRMPPSGFRR
ncbi:MAG: signal peptide peptidase SppA [Bilophila wadsworthia]